MEAYVRGVLGDSTFREPLDRALALEDDAALDELHSPSAVLADLGRLSLDLDSARRGYEAVLRHAEEVGDARSETWCAYGLGMVEALAGNWARASELADRATELSEQITLLGLPAVRLTALVAACRGDVERCRDLLRACGATAREMGDKINLLGALAIDGFLELSLGDAAAAIGPLNEAWTIQSELGLEEPGVTRFLVDLVGALSAEGRADEAEQAAAAFARQADALEREWARPLVARAEAEVLVARGDVDSALARLEAAVADEGSLPMPLERGRTLLALGSAQRRARQRRAARETLGRALAIFDDLGAVLWAIQARGELARIGGRSASSRRPHGDGGAGRRPCRGGNEQQGGRRDPRRHREHGRVLVDVDLPEARRPLADGDGAQARGRSERDGLAEKPSMEISGRRARGDAELVVHPRTSSRWSKRLRPKTPDWGKDWGFPGFGNATARGASRT